MAFGAVDIRQLPADDKRGSWYNHGPATLRLANDIFTRDADKQKETFRHELGHHADHSLREPGNDYRTVSNDFVKAFRADAACLKNDIVAMMDVRDRGGAVPGNFTRAALSQTRCRR